MPRLFLGLELPEHQCQQLLALQEPIVSLRWQTAAQLHLTVRFIGDVQDLQVAELTSALAALDAPAFLLQLGGSPLGAPPIRSALCRMSRWRAAARAAGLCKVSSSVGGDCCRRPGR